MGVHIQVTPAKGNRGNALREGGHPLFICPPLLRGAPAFSAILPLTRALKGSFLAMSSSSEDRESISRSILLTFSLGWRVRGQSTHPSLPLSSQTHWGRVNAPLRYRGVPHPTSPKAVLQDLPTCDGTWVGASGPPSSTSGGGGEGKMSSSRGAEKNGSSIIGGGGGGNAPPRAPSESSLSPIGGGGGKGKSR